MTEYRFAPGGGRGTLDFSRGGEPAVTTIEWVNEDEDAPVAQPKLSPKPPEIPAEPLSSPSDQDSTLGNMPAIFAKGGMTLAAFDCIMALPEHNAEAIGEGALLFLGLAAVAQTVKLVHSGYRRVRSK